MFLFRSKAEQKAEKLASNTYDNTPEFSFKGREFLSKVLDIYDGDTITITVKVDESYYRMNCRLDGIDTPELRSQDEEEKVAARKARKHLIDLILESNVEIDISRDEVKKKLGEANKILLVKCKDFDKYGRLLIELWTTSFHINRRMIEEGFAGQYDGGTKSEWRNYFKH